MHYAAYMAIPVLMLLCYVAGHRAGRLGEAGVWLCDVAKLRPRIKPAHLPAFDEGLAALREKYASLGLEVEA